MIKCDNLYGKFKCTRIIKTFFTDHSLPTCTCYCQSFRVSLPMPKHEQSFLVVGFVKRKYLVQYHEACSHAFVSSGFPCYVVYSIENILSFSSGKLENRPFKMGSRKAGFHCTTVKCFAPDILVLNSGDVRCWVRGREGVMFGVWLNSIKVDSNDNLTQFGSSHSGKVRTLAYIS